MPLPSQLIRKGGNEHLLKQEQHKFSPVGTVSNREGLKAAVENLALLYNVVRDDAVVDEQLLLSADHLNCALYFSLVPDEENHQLGRLLLEMGICELLEDIIMHHGFIERPSFFTDSILQGLVRLSMYAATRNRALADRLLRHAPLLWKSIWDRHSQITRFDSDELYQMVGLQNATWEAFYMLQVPALDLMRAYNLLYQAGTGTPSAPLTSFLPHVALHHMVFIEDVVRLDSSEENPIASARAIGMYLVDAVCNVASRDTLVKTALVEQGSAAANAFAERFNGELEHLAVESGNLGGVFDDVFASVQTLTRIAASSLLFKTLSAHSTHQVCVRATSQVLRSRADAKTAKMTAWLSCAGYTGELMRPLVDSMRVPAAKLKIYLRAEDIISEVARAVDLLCQEGWKLGRVYEQGPDTRFEQIVEERLVDLSGILGALKADRKRKDAKHFFQSAKAGAGVEWWPSLQALRTAQYRTSATPQRNVFRGVQEEWGKLGTLLNLSEERERKRYDREAAQHCSWKCAGCGESYYCGRECQLNDWNNGGHKQRCMRLKNGE